MRGGNCVDLKYINAFRSDNGSVLPYIEDHTKVNKKKPCLGFELAHSGGDLLPLEPCSGETKVSGLFTSTLNLTCAVALHLGLSSSQESLCTTQKEMQSGVVRNTAFE